MIEQLIDGTIEASFPMVAAAAATFTLACGLYFFGRLRSRRARSD